VKFPPAAHHIPLNEADKYIVTMKRIEVGDHIVFVRDGEKPRVRVRMSRG
jgi:hypothetical protein